MAVCLFPPLRSLSSFSTPMPETRPALGADARASSRVLGHDISCQPCPGLGDLPERLSMMSANPGTFL